MTRRITHIPGLVLALLLVAGVQATAVAQVSFSWTRATIGHLADGSAEVADFEALQSGGVQAVILPADSDPSGERWSDAVSKARRHSLRILLELPQNLTADEASAMARKAGDVGFDGVISHTAALSPDLLRPAADSDREEGFVVVAGVGVAGAASETFDAGSEQLSALPTDSAALEALFARRSPSVEDPTGAPIAFPSVDLSTLWYLLPGTLVVPVSEGTPDDPAARFRANHPAVSGGVHEKLSDAPYAFYRGIRLDRDTVDEVVVVVGAQGKTRVNVTSVWTDDTVLRDAVTGRIVMVTYGQAAVEPDPSGLVLLEVLE